MALMARNDQPGWFKDIVEEICCHQLHPEYDGYLYNHITHGVVALYFLGANESRIRRFVTWYKEQRSVTQLDILAPVHNGFGDDIGDGVSELMGKRESFHEVLSYYDNMAKREGAALLVKDFYPSLGTGLITGLLNGLIHTGYGCSVRSHEMMVEGLAYLHYAYEPFSYDMKPANDIANFGKGTSLLSSVFESITQNIELQKKVESFHQEFKHLNLGIFLPRMVGICHYLANDYIQFAHEVKLPEFFQVKTFDIIKLVRLLNWLTLKIIEVFSRSEILNDFVFLNGVIGCWSLRHVVPLLKLDDALVAFRNFLAIILAFFTLEHCPSLSRSIPDLKRPLDDTQWKVIIEEITATDADEHVFKLCQVCYCLWKEGYRGPEYDAMFVRAMNIVSKNPFGYARPGPAEGNASISNRL